MASETEVIPYEIDVELLDGALDALLALGPTGDGSIVHYRVPEADRELAWWVEEWGWTLRPGDTLGGIYGDWTIAEQDERFFAALAPHVRADGYVVCGERHGYGPYFAWVFDGEQVEQRAVSREVIFHIEAS